MGKRHLEVDVITDEYTSQIKLQPPDDRTSDGEGCRSQVVIYIPSLQI